MNSELVLLLPTSGSTGSEKMVRISRKNLESNTKSICNYLNITSNDVAITSIPMNYTYGLSVINTHLYAGARIVVTKKLPYMNEFWNICRQNNVTSFSSVPYTYEILRKMNFFPANIESLKTFTVAGGRLDSEEEEYFSKYSIENNKKFIIMYGQTEATARISYRPPEMLMEKPGSIGIAIPGGKIWIEDESGREHADESSSDYYEFDKDCTNFVSQCVRAGGVTYKENKSLTNTNIIPVRSYVYDDDTSYTYWYMKKKRSVLGQTYYYLTPSWSNVVEFRKYQNYHEGTCYKYANTSAGRNNLMKDIKVGDVVQAGDKHSIIITKKAGNTERAIEYCGHSKPREDEKLTTFFKYVNDNNCEMIYRISFK